MESRTDSMIDEYPDISGEARVRNVNYSFILTEEFTKGSNILSRSTSVPVTFSPIQFTFMKYFLSD